MTVIRVLGRLRQEDHNSRPAWLKTNKQNKNLIANRIQNETVKEHKLHWNKRQWIQLWDFHYNLEGSPPRPLRPSQPALPQAWKGLSLTTGVLFRTLRHIFYEKQSLKKEFPSLLLKAVLKEHHCTTSNFNIMSSFQAGTECFGIQIIQQIFLCQAVWLGARNMEWPRQT
jgi:hypothetical protein